MFTLDNYFYPYCDTSKVESVPLIQRACLNQKNESRNKNSAEDSFQKVEEKKYRNFPQRPGPQWDLQGTLRGPTQKLMI